MIKVQIFTILLLKDDLLMVYQVEEGKKINIIKKLILNVKN